MIKLFLEPYDGFLTNIDEKGNIISFNSDISLLQRSDIVDMLPQSLDSLFDKNASNNPYDGMSDDDIISHTKSRRLQSPSELSDWSKSLELESKIEASKLIHKSKTSIPFDSSDSSKSFDKSKSSNPVDSSDSSKSSDKPQSK